MEFGMHAADTIVIPLKRQRKELGPGTAHRRDWKGVTIALFVIFIICGLIFLCGYLFTPLHNNDFDDSRQLLNLTDLKRFRSSTGSPNWLRDGRLFFESEEGINILNPNGNYSSIITYREIHDILQRGASAQCNFDCSIVSLRYAVENPSVNPDNSSNIIHVFDLKTRKLVRVTADSQSKQGTNYLQWSPNGNDFIFVQNGHLYYVAKPGETPLDISTSSKGNTQIHGYFDWMTEEEIFGTRQASWWAKDGSRLAFASRDVATDPAITLTAYKGGEKYQIDTKLVYPKTGEKKLPTYRISIWDKSSGATKQMDVQLRDSLSFHYLFGVSWIKIGDKQVLSATWANRWQNQTSFTICDFDTGMCSLVYEHSYPPKMWALPEEYRNLVTTKDSVFLILPRQMHDGNSYQHIARVKIEGDTKQFLSLGNFDVKKVAYHDENSGLLYFMTTAPQPTKQHLYVTKDNMPAKDAFRCVTCNLPNCTFAAVTFSSNGSRLSIVCHGPSYPHYYLGNLKAGYIENVQEVLHDSKLEQLVAETALPVIVDDVIQLENGFQATTRLLLPKSSGHIRAIPLLVYVYGGPGFHTIDDRFTVQFVDYLVTNLHIAVLRIDARGSGDRGWKYRSPLYGALGHVEMQDFIETTSLVLKKYNYLDPTKVALHGWSYGGFATLRMVEMAPEKFFRCAISGAPVTNFQYYDAAYTERYMGAAPKEAYVDVSQGDLTKFKTTRLLLIHGLSDDNVHFQNSAVFAEAMQINHIDFEFMVYPNERHHLTGEKMIHAYERMTKFLDDCLLK